VGADRLRSLLEEFHLPDLEEIADEIIGRSERAMRAGIEALPDGTYVNEAWTDGFDEPIVLRCSVTVDGDEMQVDWTGSSPQSPFGINLVLNYTHAYASYAMKAAVAPEVPHNDGAFRPVHVSAPLGSILNCEHPAPVASRHVIGHFLPGVIFGALAPAVPGRLLAGSADALWITVWQGRDRARRPFVQTVFQLGGMGARPSKDGLSATGFPSGVAGMPAEVVESLSPLVFRRRELTPGTGGPGRFRGGLGQNRVITCSTDDAWSVSGLLDRTRHPAPGLAGGLPGAAGAYRLLGGDDLPIKRVVELRPDAAVELRLPGGGGYGPPAAREPAAVLADVVDGYISAEEARALYGVVVRYRGAPDALVRLPGSYELDHAATGQLRGHV
jgi:N-methylhydantoinase B